MPEPAPRLIDLHIDWLCQYAPETNLFGPKTGDIASIDLRQSEFYMSVTSAAVISLSRDAEDWSRQSDPWRSLGDLIARVEAEFSGRILIGPDDAARWRDDSDGLTWAVIGVEGWDFLVRTARDLDHLAGLFERGVRVFQPIHGRAGLLGGSSEPGDDRGLSDLGREYLDAMLAMSLGSKPAVDLAGMNARTCSDIFDWFEADTQRGSRIVPIVSHIGVSSPVWTDHAILTRLRAIGGVIGFTPNASVIENLDAFRRAIEDAAAIPFRGREGFDGITIGSNLLRISATFPEMRNAEQIRDWVLRSFSPNDAKAIVRGNAETLFDKLAGAHAKD